MQRKSGDKTSCAELKEEIVVTVWFDQLTYHKEEVILNKLTDKKLLH